MSYRSIIIDGKTYNYVIGKKYTKIVDVGVFSNKEIGNIIINSNGVIISYMVTPKNIEYFLRGISDKPTKTCHHGTTSAVFLVNPFVYEVYGKTSYMPNCEICYNNLLYDI